MVSQILAHHNSQKLHLLFNFKDATKRQHLEIGILSCIVLIGDYMAVSVKAMILLRIYKTNRTEIWA